MNRPTFFRAVALAAAATALSSTLAACSDNANDADNGSEPSANYNDADVEFVQQMIPHHQQATEMAAMAEGRSQSTEVLDLAEQIEAAQGPEIEVMTGLLEEWDVEADGAEMDHTDMGHGSSGGMEGMMSDEEMDALDQSSGPEFDQMFLTMMIEHHQGAVEMAEDEQANGQNDDALELAGQIATSQTAEIDVMRALLAQ